MCNLFFLWRLLGSSRTSDEMMSERPSPHILRSSYAIITWRHQANCCAWGWSSDTRGIHTLGPKGPECWLWHMELHQAFLGEFAQVFYDFLCRKLCFFVVPSSFSNINNIYILNHVSRCKIMQEIPGWCHVGHGILILHRDWKMGFAWHPQILDLWTSKLCDWYCAIKIHGWGWQEN